MVCHGTLLRDHNLCIVRDNMDILFPNMNEVYPNKVGKGEKHTQTVEQKKQQTFIYSEGLWRIYGE